MYVMHVSELLSRVDLSTHADVSLNNFVCLCIPLANEVTSSHAKAGSTSSTDKGQQ